MTGRPCDIPGDDHDGQARLYPCGWRCTTHAPQTRTTPVAEPAAIAAVQRMARKDPAEESRRVIGALRIDLGEGHALKDKGPGEFWWKTKPRARYECLACRWESETVTGPEAVKAFAAHIRTTHKAACPGAVTEGAQAA